MKFLTIKILALSVVALPVFVGAEEIVADDSLGSRLANCGVFFGVISQGNSPFSEAMKAFSLAANTYLTVAIPDVAQAESQAGKAKSAFGSEWGELKADKDAFRKKYEECIDTLKIGEKTLRPRMDEPTKTLIPAFFE